MWVTRFALQKTVHVSTDTDKFYLFIVLLYISIYLLCWANHGCHVELLIAVTLTADGQLINMSGALVGTLSLANSGMLAGATQLTSMLAAVATNNSLLAAQATTAVPNGEHTTQPLIVEEQQVESDSR